MVLLLCAVSLTGAAYAYTSSVTVIDNNVHVEGLTLNLQNVDDGTEVGSSIYNFKFAYGDHTLKGDSAEGKTKAIRYDYGTDTYKGFALDDDSNPVYQGVVTSADLEDLTKFADGYYVDTMFAVDDEDYDEPVGYYNVINWGTGEPTAAQLSEKYEAGNLGVYKLGDSYTLKVTNQSNKGIELKLNAKYANTPIFGEGVRGIYAVITGTIAATDDSAEVSVNKVIRLDKPVDNKVSGVITEFAKDQATAGANLNIQVYLECSDYHSASALTYTDKDYSFVLNFTANTVAPPVTP